MSWWSFAALHRRIAPWLILLLVLAAGVRLCLPVGQVAGHAGNGIHLESVLTAVADHHESHPDAEQDLPLLAVLGLFGLGLAAAVLATRVPAAFAPDRSVHPVRPRDPDERCLRPPRGAGVTPQLRAPPR